MNNNKAPGGAIEVKKEFSKTLESGAELSVVISANITNLGKDDTEEACSVFSQFSRNFYMHMGNEIKNTL